VNAEAAMKATSMAKLDAELRRLAAQYEMAMSAFRFDEARAVQKAIADVRAAREENAATLPANPTTPPDEQGAAPTLLRPRRLRRR
jgi:hypothetical protein